MTDFIGHFLVFALLAIGFLAAPLLLGRLVRPKLPTPEKDAVYECGEPTIGSSYIQFDLRFYVVALLFIVFDVEVAFFFPWASVFGAATQLSDARLSEPVRAQLSQDLLAPAGSPETALISAESARHLSQFLLIDILVFFGVLLVGFAYLWRRGDLDWVRAVTQDAREAASRPRAAIPAASSEMAASAT